jgi:hypothetical protein
MSLFERETAALDQFTKGSGALVALINDNPCHPSDRAELVSHIHSVQNIVMARSAVRADLGKFNHLRSFCDPFSFGTQEGAELCQEAHD